MDRHISIAELEEKLEARDKENNRLRQNIRLKDSELAQLQDKCNEKSDKIGKLETKHGMVSAQVKQLKGMVETRFPDEMEDGLMEKTLLAAEATHQAERLEEKLKKTKIEREALREEIQSLIKQNDALSQKLHKTIASHERLRQERNMNNKVFLELDDVVTTLDNISLESGDDVLLEDENDNVSIKNIRRKIQAIENDRQRVIKQCKNLEEETIFKDAKISSMESKYYNHGNDRGIRTDTFRPHGSVRMDRKNDYGDSSRRPLIEEEDRSEYSSDSSAIEAPHVSLEVYAEIKKEYESTLREMVKLTEELQTSKSSLRGYEQSTNETENRFTELSDEYKEALLELSNMRRDIDKSEIRLQGALAAKEDMKNAYDSRLTEMSDAYEYLEENYNKLKDDQNEKLANLEKEVSNSEKFFENECMRLKKENQGNTQVLMYTEKKRFEDLRLDNESLVEAQGRLKEELVRLKEKYDKSLKKIVYLEESVKEEKQITEQTMLNSSQESTIRYNTLKKDYNALLVAQESAGNSVTGYYQKLEYHCQSLEGKLRNTKDEADARYQELRDCYESALSTIDKLEMKLADAEERTKRENNQKKAKSKYDIAFDRIADLERDLMSDKGDAVKFEKLKYDSSTLQNTVFEGQDGAGIKDAISDIGLQHFCDFLQHQRKLKFALYDLIHKIQETDQNSTLPPTSFYHALFLEEDLDIAEFQIGGSNNEVLDTLTVTISKLLDQLTKVKILASASRIRYKAQEKQLKLVFMQYKKVLKQYSSAISSTSNTQGEISSDARDRISSEIKAITRQEDSSTTATEDSSSSSEMLYVEHNECTDPPGIPAISPDEGDRGVEISKFPNKMTVAQGVDEDEKSTKVIELMESLRAAESKVEKVELEIRVTQQKAEEAQREQEEKETNLRIMLAKHKELKAKIMAHTETCITQDKNPDTVESSDGSSLCVLSTTAKARIERIDNPEIKDEGMAGRYLKLKQEYDEAVDKISIIEKELREKKQETEFTKSKLEAREKELLDVIQRYKELHQEYDGFLEGDALNKDSNLGLSKAKLIQERDAARWKISEIQAELREAKESTNTAVAKQTLVRQHLRDVIFQYKTLQREHTSLVAKIEGLRGAIPTKGQTSISHNLSIQEEKPKLPSRIPSPSVSSKRTNSTYQVPDKRIRQQGIYNDTQSVSTFASQKTTFSKKKRFVKALYREVKLKLKSNSQSIRKGQEIKSINDFGDRNMAH